MIDKLPFDWESEWQGMPEFVQEKQAPFAQLTIRFSNADDLEKFALLINQKLTPKTKSIWFPALTRGINAGKRWKHEE